MLRQVKTITFSDVKRIYVAYNNILEICDKHGNQLNVQLTEQQLKELQDAAWLRIKRNLENVREQLAQELEAAETPDRPESIDDSDSESDEDEDEDDDDDEEDEGEDEEQAEYEDDVPTPVLAEQPGTITNSIGMKLVPIPAGTFLMGSPEDEEKRSENEQQHEVTLTKDFYLGMTQVTQAQYEEVMGENLSRFQGDNVSGRDSSEFPVEQVSWDDALKFCEKLSSLPDEIAAGRVYRLPTEAEWEYACRAGSSTAYFFGDDEESLSDYAWYLGNSGWRPHPVTLKKPNAWGLYDMCGNVFEWCSDWYEYDYPKGAVSDPAGPKGGSDRVYRGGCWRNVAAFCKSSDRNRSPPATRSTFFGFRLALSPSGIPESPEADK